MQMTCWRPMRTRGSGERDLPVLIRDGLERNINTAEFTIGLEIQHREKFAIDCKPEIPNSDTSIFTFLLDIKQCTNLSIHLSG